MDVGNRIRRAGFQHLIFQRRTSDTNVVLKRTLSHLTFGGSSDASSPLWPRATPFRSAPIKSNLMFFSTDPQIFHQSKRCSLDNGTTFYLNTTSWRNLDCSCATTWTADPNIAGDAVVTFFLALAGVTVLASLVPVIYELLQSWKANKGHFWHWIDDVLTLHLVRTWPEPDPSARAGSDYQRNSAFSDASNAEIEKAGAPNDENYNNQNTAVAPVPTELRNKFVLATQDLLVPLCNAQIFAGIIWVVWALSEWDHLTYYHEQFVINFWWLGLTSVWISRVDHISLDSIHNFRSRTQRLILLVGVALACVLQIMVADREHNHWNPTTHGTCYLSRDGSGEDINQNVFWVIGTIVYGIALLSSFMPSRSSQWDRWISSPLDKGMSRVALTVHRSVSSLQLYHNHRSQDSMLKRLLAYSYAVIKIICFGSIWFACWCLVQFMSVWGAGKGSFFIETGAYVIFAASSMFYIVAMKLDNRTLEVGREDTLALGPLVVILMTAGILYTHYTR